MAGLGWLFGELKSYGYTDTQGKEILELIRILNDYRKKDGKEPVAADASGYRQNTKYEEIAKDEKKVLTKDNSGGTMSSFPKTNGFRNDNDRKLHTVHLREFGLTKFSDYENKAIDFANNGEGEVYRTKDRYYKYNPETAELIIVGKDNNLISYYIPKGGDLKRARNYVDNMIKNKGGKKI